MACADLRDELKCSICLSPYTDPVTLRCGHHFCCSCIVSALDAQKATGGYFCPECRTKYPAPPALEKNRTLRNLVERFLSPQPDMKNTGIFCTYCSKSPVKAVRTCLQCESSLCGKHLIAHNKELEHILIEPTGSLSYKKCSLHKKVLEYYCPQDEAYLCVSCLIGEHRGHQVELLDEASEKKKKLREYLDDLNPQKAEIKERLQNLKNCKKKIQEKASDKRKNISKIFMDVKKRLEKAERRALRVVSRQEEKIVYEISQFIKKLEIQENELSRKMRHVVEMCHVTDPIRLLQGSDITVCSHGGDEATGGDGVQDLGCEDVGLDTGHADVHVSNTKGPDNTTDPIIVPQESEQEASVSGLHVTTDDLDEVLISLTLHRSIRDIFTDITSELGVQVPDILLDVDTANECVEISEDLKTASDSDEKQERPESPGKFVDYSQVLSRCGFSSGRHYWEVESNQTGRCGIGMSYPSIEREEENSEIGANDKSWCLFMYKGKYGVHHNLNELTLNVEPESPIIGVFLDYEAGRLSFYEMCDHIRLLHTFTASFTEPLHVLFYVYNGASVTIS